MNDFPQAAILAAARAICTTEHGEGAWADCEHASEHQAAAIDELKLRAAIDTLNRARCTDPDCDGDAGRAGPH